MRFWTTGLALVVVLGLLVHGAGTSEATILIKKDLAQLAAESDHVIVGKVESTRARWDLKLGLILTDTTITVERALKGKPGKSIVVTEVGGTVGDLTQRIEGVPQYAAGQRVLLTIKKGPAGYWRTHGWIQGRFSVITNRATESHNALRKRNHPNSMNVLVYRLPSMIQLAGVRHQTMLKRLQLKLN